MFEFDEQIFKKSNNECKFKPSINPINNNEMWSWQTFNSKNKSLIEKYLKSKNNANRYKKQKELIIIKVQFRKSR